MAIFGPLKIPEIGFTKNLGDIKSLCFLTIVGILFLGQEWLVIVDLITPLNQLSMEGNWSSSSLRKSENYLFWFYRNQLTPSTSNERSRKRFEKLRQNIPEINKNRLKIEKYEFYEVNGEFLLQNGEKSKS